VAENLSATPLPRTIVYIDSFNLYYGCLKHTPYRWLNVEQMCTLLLPDHHILAIKYYTARIKPPADDPDKAVRQEVYLRALAYCVLRQAYCALVASPRVDTGAERWGVTSMCCQRSGLGCDAFPESRWRIW
jgi:hypothetical protein